MAKLECSKSTLHRTINALKDYLNAPVVFDANARGYRYAKDVHGEAYELPGLWFTPSELQALEVMQRLLKDAGGGLLEEHLGPLAQRLNEITKHQRLNLSEAASRLRFPSIGSRPRGQTFDAVASATLQRKTVYGIFGGKADKIATLRFSPERARWVADEKWHPQQEGRWLPEGGYELKIPYRNPRELVMDIMRHGSGVEVITPSDLRAEVEDQLRRALEQYSRPAP